MHMMVDNSNSDSNIPNHGEALISWVLLPPHWNRENFNLDLLVMRRRNWLLNGWYQLLVMIQSGLDSICLLWEYRTEPL